jgi:hypothetical protein
MLWSAREIREKEILAESSARGEGQVDNCGGVREVKLK